MALSRRDRQAAMDSLMASDMYRTDTAAARRDRFSRILDGVACRGSPDHRTGQLVLPGYTLPIFAANTTFQDARRKLQAHYSSSSG